MDDDWLFDNTDDELLDLSIPALRLATSEVIGECCYGSPKRRRNLEKDGYTFEGAEKTRLEENETCYACGF